MDARARVAHLQSAHPVGFLPCATTTWSTCTSDRGHHGHGVGSPVGGQKSAAHPARWRRSAAAIGDPAPMIELLGLLLATLGSVLRSRQRLLVENLLLRQQLRSLSVASAVPASAPGTSLSGPSSAGSTGTGDATSFWSGPRPYWVGTARAGASSGAGGPAQLSDGHA